MKILTVSVTDEHGNTHTWEGTGGHLDTIAIRESVEGGSKQAPGRLVGKQIVASLTIPADHPDPRTVRRSAVDGQFVTAAEAAAHPDTTVTERVDG